jgi:hypothetical protein
MAQPPFTAFSMWPTDYLLERATQLRAMAQTATTQEVVNALNRLAGRFEGVVAERRAAVDASPQH